MNYYIYVLAMAVTTYLIRMLPITFFRKKIKSRFIRSFLCYVPITCLSAMTFPAILFETGTIISAVLALLVAIFLSFKGKSLIVVAVASCVTVYLSELIISFSGL